MESATHPTVCCNPTCLHEPWCIQFQALGLLDLQLSQGPVDSLNISADPASCKAIAGNDVMRKQSLHTWASAGAFCNASTRMHVHDLAWQLGTVSIQVESELSTVYR